MIQSVAIYLLIAGKFDAKVARDLLAASILAPLTYLAPLEAQSSVMEPPSTNVQIVSEKNYLPRLLYPGTYKNFCGPTPETSIKDGCRAHGWHGDDALDPVDNACRLHDVAYCHCEADLMARKGQQDKNAPPMLASLVALRFVTDPILRAEGVDSEYLSCVHKADTKLIATGIRIRGEQQRSGCKGDLKWFCSNAEDSLPKWNTLAAFEKVNLRIFLKDLDADERQSGTTSASLTQMEMRRHEDLITSIRSGKRFPDAAAGAVQQDEEQMLKKLTTED